MNTQPVPHSNFLLYTSLDGDISIDVQFLDETAWLTQDQMAKLFGKAKSTINEHIGNVYSEGELKESDTMRKFGISELSTKPTNYYNLDVIISVGYRVKSQRGTQFRVWATQKLRDYIIKGFVLDDERLKQGATKNSYFDELIERVRDIRTSERNFYQKITDIYTTSIDYDPKSELTQAFFATVQNKMHFGIHGKTAAEVIAERADGSKATMGITCIPKEKIRKKDIFIAKNYLSQDELSELNLIVDQYLSFAELQARNRTSMTMENWVEKLDDFLRLNEKEILQSKGSISKQFADQKAANEYDVFQAKRVKEYESDFDRVTKKLLKDTNASDQNTQA